MTGSNITFLHSFVNFLISETKIHLDGKHCQSPDIPEVSKTFGDTVFQFISTKITRIFVISKYEIKGTLTLFFKNMMRNYWTFGSQQMGWLFHCFVWVFLIFILFKYTGRTMNIDDIQCLKLSQKSCRSSLLEFQIINIQLKKNSQKVPGPPPKLSASDWRACGNFQHWWYQWYTGLILGLHLANERLFLCNDVSH